MTFAGRFLAYLDRQSKSFLWLAVLVFLLSLALIDYYLGFEISFSIFYILPVALASWALGKSAGIGVALVSAAMSQGTSLLAGQHLSSPLIYFWNVTARFGFFLILSTLLVEIRGLLSNETHLSRTDFLTGVFNRRALFEAAAVEMDRLIRTGRPLTVVYMDVDNFKSINDALGHASGDAVLTEIAATLRHQVRGFDVVGRMGGDEYVVLLPETDEGAARQVGPRLQGDLLRELHGKHWPITFSIGILTCSAAPSSAGQLFHLADQVMYRAKRAGKNTICCGAFPT